MPGTSHPELSFTSYKLLLFLTGWFIDLVFFLASSLLIFPEIIHVYGVVVMLLGLILRLLGFLLCEQVCMCV
jgi:hypothetical protein